MAPIDIPSCLNQAREEIMLALGASTAQAETEHRQRAAAFVARAVNDIDQHPDTVHDWAMLEPIG